MTTALLYFTTAALLIWLTSRFVVRISGIAAVVIVLLPLCFTGKALLTGRVYAPIDLAFGAEPLASMAHEHGIGAPRNPILTDVVCLNIPWKSAARAALRRHEWPLWNPFLFCGDILAGASQPTPYEPVFLLSTLLPMANSLTFLAAMAFFLAGLGMFLFLREMGCSEAAAIAGAVGWMYGTFLVFWLEWVITTTVLWLPFVLTGVRRIIRSGGTRGFTLLTIAFVMMILNGHPESALHIVAIGLLWAAWELWSVRAKGWFRACAAGAGAGALALLLCAIFLLPVIEAIPQTMENLFRSAIYTKAHRSLPPEEALQRLRLNVLPFEYGDPGDSVRAASEPEYPHFDNGYAGTVVLALAILGLWRSPQREKWVLLAVLGVGVLIGNDFPPFADWLAKLPLFDVAINSRMLFAQTFALAALAALGVERLRDVVDRRRFAAVCACLAAIVGAIVLLRWDPMIASELTAEFLARHTAFLLLPLIAALLCARLVRGERALLASIVLVLIVQRTAEHGGFYPTIDAAAFYPKIEVLAGLPADGEPYRITAAGNVLWPNFATIYGLEDVRGYQAMTFNRMRQTYGFWCVPQPVWSNRIDDLGRPFLDALNVRHALASPDYHPPAWWHKVKEQPGVQLLENDRVLGRAFVPARIRLEEDDGRTLKEISEATDFRQRGWVRMRGHHGEEIPNGAGHVATIRGGLGRLAMTATMDAPGWIIISETAWKGWKAYIDQKRTPLYFGDHALLALYVPAGKHAILLSYLPRSFVLGRAITFATIAGLLVFGVARWRWKRYGVSDSTSHSR